MQISLYYLIIPALILGSCGPNTNPGSNTPADSTSTAVDTDNLSKMQDTATSTGVADSASGISMIVSPDTVKARAVGKATLTISNNASDEITFGDLYKVEYNNGGSWERVTLFDDIAFTAMAHSIAPGQSQEFPIHLQPIPYEYKPGQYRVLKDAQTAGKNIQLTATFSVEK